jgi:hypothetical protein
MRRISMICATLAAVAVLAPNQKAVAGGGDVAVGLLGGLAAGTIIGSAFAPRVYYAPPPYPVEVEYEAAPVMIAPNCYWTRGAPVWDGYRGIWVRPRVQVCN